MTDRRASPLSLGIEWNALQYVVVFLSDDIERIDILAHEELDESLFSRVSLSLHFPRSVSFDSGAAVEQHTFSHKFTYGYFRLQIGDLCHIEHLLQSVELHDRHLVFGECACFISADFIGSSHGF